MIRLLGATLAAAAAYWFARGVGIPTWRDWEPGDASDIAVCVLLGSLAARTKGAAMTSVFYPARVALLRHREFTEVRIRAGRERAHLRFLNPGTISSLNPARPRISNSAVFLPTSGGGSLRRSVEPTRTLMAPLLRIFSQGTTGNLEFLPAFRLRQAVVSSARPAP